MGHANAAVLMLSPRVPEPPVPAGFTAPVTPDRPIRLRVLSYNIQIGVQTARYGDYVTRAWRHALPGNGMPQHLDRLADVMRHFEFVAVQEADAGSLRTRFVNQIEYLARRAGFSSWGLSVTRDLRPIACHALGFLSRHVPTRVVEYALPSRLPGRRVISIDLGADAGHLHVLVAHLSLGAQARQRQLDFVDGLVPATGPVLLLGDLNCEARVLRQRQGSRLLIDERTPATFPSWRPRRALDHILHSADIRLHRLHALPMAISDHLPLAAEIELPAPPR